MKPRRTQKPKLIAPTSYNRDKIEEFLEYHGPSTVEEIAKGTGINFNSAHSCISTTRRWYRNGPPKYWRGHFYIDSYLSPDEYVYRGGTHSPRWAIGWGKDAPLPTKQPKKVVDARYRRRHVVEMKLKRERRQGNPVHHFTQLIRTVTTYAKTR